MSMLIATPEQLSVLAASLQRQASQSVTTRVLVSMGTCGIAAGARDVLTHLAAELSEASVENVTLGQSGCAGLCDQEPMLTLTDKTGKEFRYGKLTQGRIHEIVRDHILGGKPAAAYLIPS